MPDFLRFLVLAVVGILIPIILVDYPPPDVYRRRFLIAVVAAVLGALFTGLSAQSMGVTDALSTFVVAAAASTLLYSLGNLFFGAASEAKRR